MARKVLCQIPGCGRPHNARGMCNMHYARWRMGLRGEALLAPPKNYRNPQLEPDLMYAPPPPPPTEQCDCGGGYVEDLGVIIDLIDDLRTRMISDGRREG